MMKKHTSRGIAMLKEAALIPLFIVLVFAFSKATAQSAGQSSMSKEEFYKGATIYIYSATGKSVTKKYDEMTTSERTNLPEPKSPTAGLITAWKRYVHYPVIVNSKLSTPTDAPEQCRFFIDGENVESSTLDKYQPSDFVSYTDIKFVKGGFSLIDANLYTKKYVESLTGDARFIMINDKQALVGRPNPPFMIPEKYRQAAKN